MRARAVSFVLLAAMSGFMLGLSACTPNDPSTPAVQQPVSPWENIFTTGEVTHNRWVTDRMKVKGGWIYRQSVFDTGHGMSVALCFVPDPAVDAKPEAPR